MKSMLRVLIILVAGTLSAAMAQCQYAPMTLKASVPFEFSVENKSFPAGDYLIQRVGPHMLTLRDAGGKFLAVIQTNQVQTLDPHGSASIRFRTVGDRHVLEQVWQEGVTIGYQLSVPRERGSLMATQAAPAHGSVSNEGMSGHE